MELGFACEAEFAFELLHHAFLAELRPNKVYFVELLLVVQQPPVPTLEERADQH